MDYLLQQMTGVMEFWSIGVMEGSPTGSRLLVAGCCNAVILITKNCKKGIILLFPILHDSTTPALQWV